MMTILSEMDVHSLTPKTEFTESEMQAMHSYCLEYRDLVRGGGMPTPYQNIHFMLYQVFCYAAGGGN